jgi:uncharacterized DUF497 family protein
VRIEYDERKNQKNIWKHNISIPDLATIFENPFTSPVMDIPVVKHSQREKRYWAFGWTTTGWYVKIWYCYRGDGIIRIIGGRKLK